MRKSLIIFIGTLWMLALVNMWLLMRAGDEHARLAASRAEAYRWQDPTQGGSALHIVNAPPDFPVANSGPPTRKHRAH